MRKHFRLLTAAVLAISAQCAHADGQALSGLGLQFAFGMASTITHDSTIDDATTVNAYGASSSAAAIGVGYAHTFDGNFNVGNFLSHFNLGTYLNVDLNRDKVGGWTNSTSSYELRLRSLKSIALQPGMILGRTSLVYIKAAYWSGDFQVDYKSTTGTSESNIHRTHAWSAGIGLRSQINRHLTLGVEAEQLQFSTVAVDFPLNGVVLTEKPKQLRASAIVGVVF